jgi:two-component system phosphate regulon sensor histidine kinase PhoR
MFSSFRARLTGTYLALIIIIMVTFGIVIFNTVKEYYMKNVESNLIYEARLVAEMIKQSDQQMGGSRFQEICKIAGKDTDTRVTIINRSGKVLGDSEFDPAKLGLHNSRPEVYKALMGKTGIEVRYSETAKTNMIYVAIPFTSESSDGVVRMSTPLVEAEKLYNHIWTVLLLAILATGIAAVLISLIMAARFSMPLKDITEAVKDMAQGNLRRRISYKGKDEFGILANAFNDMAEYLDKNINEISGVRNRLEALLYNTVNGIIMIDAVARITYVNPVAISLLEETNKIIGKKYTEVINNYELLEIIDRVRKQLQPEQREIVMHSLGGKTVDVNIVPILNNSVDCQGFLVVLNDITSITKLEQVRKDFVANVSHELKTPVAAISGFAETLVEEEGQNPETVKEFSQIIFDESQRLSRLVNRLLELSRLESDNRELHIEPLDINQLIQDTINIMQKRNDCQDRIIDFKKTNYPIIIKGDHDVIAQVLINLLDNAIKYGPDGDHIIVSLEEHDNAVKISVEDHGVGIPDNEMGRVFERFYRVDKTRSRKTGGTGLGLAIAKHLVENHGGQIGVETIYGKGTIFSFTVPNKK